jgi:hypothetical protein
VSQLQAQGSAPQVQFPVPHRAGNPFVQTSGQSSGAPEEHFVAPVAGLLFPSWGRPMLSAPVHVQVPLVASAVSGVTASGSFPTTQSLARDWW